MTKGNWLIFYLTAISTWGFAVGLATGYFMASHQ
jgi:hypothetical protein